MALATIACPVTALYTCAQMTPIQERYRAKRVYEVTPAKGQVALLHTASRWCPSGSTTKAAKYACLLNPAALYDKLAIKLAMEEDVWSA